ncbi:hypothetical protein L917_07368 [Phytophthora nicotianae]|uniref:Uncharacterized protein n=1 Tax=Phytophthora nicotianae TaxID=4792 RepID=W2LBG3_PHYNI|nr:hypothetical protein L917_07368 [Phytophthora nicotianae]
MDVDGKGVLCKRCGKLVHASGLTWNESKNTSTAAARNVCRLTRSRISTSRL